MFNLKEKMRKLDHKLKLKPDNLVFDVHNYDVDIQSNHIYLMGVDRGYESTPGDHEPGIEFTIANRFVRNINLCMRANSDKPVIVHMKSCGGYWEEGMAIYDAIKSCPSKVTILSYTHARSMTSIILQAADKRVLMPNSYFMFHDGTYAIEGTVKQVRSNLQFDKRTEITMLNIYAEKMNRKGEFKGQGVTRIKKWLRDMMNTKEDVFLTAHQAVEYGLADSVFNGDWSSLTRY